ncbi:MAG: hypothetical protein GEV10_31500 [Streptosporangiales bacterium]|nr:hypothetical protein [Streptosporangiales bacterium]
MMAKRGPSVLDGWKIRHRFDGVMVGIPPYWVSEAVGPDPVGTDKKLAVLIEWEAIRGRAEPVSITVRSVQPSDPPKRSVTRELAAAGHAVAGVSATSVRKLGIGDMVDALRPQVAEEWRSWRRRHPDQRPEPIKHGDRKVWSLDALLASSAEPFAAKAGRGLALEPDIYVEAARVYKEAYATRSPTQAVADHFTISKDAAAKRVARARERGLLPRTTRGKSNAVAEGQRRTSRRKT